MMRRFLIGSLWLMACGTEVRPDAMGALLDAGAASSARDDMLDATRPGPSQVLPDGSNARTREPDAEPPQGSPPSCGERMKVSVFATPVDFGASSPRANWRLSGELRDAGPPSPDLGAPDAGATYRWRGVTSSLVALSCGPEGREPCTGEGSQVQLKDSAGQLTALHLHFQPNELPAIEDGAVVSLTADTWRASVMLTDAAGQLILGVVRNGSRDGYNARSWSFANVSIHTEGAVCVADETRCNWRLSAQNIVANAGAGESVIAPGESGEVTSAGARYRVVNHAAVQFGTVQEGGSCAAYRFGLDSIGVLRR